MTLVGIFGSLGSGKTLLLTILGYLAKMRDNAYVLSNYKTTFADYTASIEEILLMLEDLVRPEPPNLCLFDELGTLLKAVDFMQSDNELLTSIFLKSRKRGADIYYTSQSAMMVDRNVRRITDVVLFTNFDKRKNKVYAQRADSTGTGWISQEKGNLSFEAEPYFDFYDTNEIIETDRFKILDYLYDKVIQNKELMRRMENINMKERIKLVTFTMKVSNKLASLIDTMIFKD